MLKIIDEKEIYSNYYYLYGWKRHKEKKMEMSDEFKQKLVPFK